MKILFLGYAESPLLEFLRKDTNDVVQKDERINAEWVRAEGYEFLISFGYKHILKKDILELFPDRAINLHISYLPWNRGADPNFWSIVDGTPAGVTIHLLDEGVDTGDILFQQQVEFSETDTLRSSYQKLQSTLCELFYSAWPKIRNNTCLRIKQAGKGSMHRKKDRLALSDALPQGWDTPIKDLIEFGRRYRT